MGKEKPIIENRMEKFRKDFEKKRYYFTSKEALRQTFLAYTFYEIKQEGISAVLLEGPPRSGKDIFC